MLISFRELLTRVPVSERTLRTVIAELGLRPPPGRHKLLFNERQVDMIEKALACRHTLSAYVEEIVVRSGTPSREEINRRRAARTRQTREVLKRIGLR